MKTTKEIADAVFKIRDEHEKQQAIKYSRIKKISYICTPLCAAFLIVVGINIFMPAISELPNMMPQEATTTTVVTIPENSDNNNYTQNLDETNAIENNSVYDNTETSESNDCYNITKPADMIQSIMPVTTSKVTIAPAVSCKPTKTTVAACITTRSNVKLTTAISRQDIVTYPTVVTAYEPSVTTYINTLPPFFPTTNPIEPALTPPPSENEPSISTQVDFNPWSPGDNNCTDCPVIPDMCMEITYNNEKYSYSGSTLSLSEVESNDSLSTITVSCYNSILDLYMNYNAEIYAISDTCIGVLFEKSNIIYVYSNS